MSRANCTWLTRLIRRRDRGGGTRILRMRSRCGDKWPPSAITCCPISAYQVASNFLPLPVSTHREALRLLPPGRGGKTLTQSPSTNIFTTRLTVAWWIPQAHASSSWVRFSPVAIVKKMLHSVLDNAIFCLAGFLITAAWISAIRENNRTAAFPTASRSSGLSIELGGSLSNSEVVGFHAFCILIPTPGCLRSWEQLVIHMHFAIRTCKALDYIGLPSPSHVTCYLDLDPASAKEVFD